MSNTIEKQVLDLGTLPTKGIDYWTPEEEAEMNNAKNGALVAAQEARTAKQETDAATGRANEAATNANGAAGVAREEAGRAEQSAENANDATVNANRAAADANRAYNTVTQYHDTVTVPDHNRAEQDHSRAEQDHTRHVEDHQEAVRQRAAEDAEFQRTQQEKQAEFARTEKARQDEFDSKEAVRDAANAEAVRFAGNMADVNRDMGKYQQLPDVTLTLVENGKRIDNEGNFVADSSFNIGRLGAVSKGNIYELLMGGSDKMVLGTALFVSHTVEKIGGQDKDVYKPIYSAVTADLPISTYAVLLAGEDYSDVLVSYRNDVAGANVLKVARWGIFASIATQLANLRGDVDLKSFSDGYYDNMGVGFAKNLIGDGEATHEEFTERVAGGSHQIDDSLAEYVTIKGNSVVWNQLVKFITNSDSFSKNNISWKNGKLILKKNYQSATYCGVTVLTPVKIAHKYLVIFAHEPNSSLGDTIVCQNGSTPYTYGIVNANNLATIIVTANASGALGTVNIFTHQPSDTFEIEIYSIQLIDLTKMFGEGNEPTTYEEYLKRKPVVEDEFAYNEGTIVNMTAEGVKTTGRNLWDEEWEQGSINAQGVLVVAMTTIRSMHFHKCLPNTSYCYSCQSAGGKLFYWYDEDYNFIYRNEFSSSAARFGVATSPNNAAYFKIRFDQPTYNHDICINISDPSFNGQYEPHITSERKWTETMKKCFPDGMAKAGNVYDEFGATKAVKRIGVVDLGSLSWHKEKAGNNYTFYSEHIPYQKQSDGWTSAPNVMCLGFNITGRQGLVNATEDTMSVGYGGDSRFYVMVSSLNSEASTVSECKSYFQGKWAITELAEPIVTTYDELNLTSRVWRNGTEEIIVPEGKESSPISADVIYQTNAFKTIKANKQGIEDLNAKPAISLTAEEVAKLRALINTNTQNLED